MFRASMFVILICLYLTVCEGRYNSKRTRFVEARNADPPLRRLMFINNAGYKLSDQHRNRVWDIYRTKMGIMNPTYVNQAEGEVSNVKIIQADGRRGLQVDIGIDHSSRLGLASPVSANSFVWTPIMTPRKAPRTDDTSINEIDSRDYLPPNTVKTSTTTDKPDIIWGVLGNRNGLVPGPHTQVDSSEVEWLTTTTAAPETRMAVPEYPTSLTEFFNAQLSLLALMWTNFTKLTDYFGREVVHTVSSGLDFLWEIFVLFFSDRKRIDIEYDISEL